MINGMQLGDLLIVWLPVVFAVLLGLIGLLRGVRREAVVSLSIVLAALILSLWVGKWAAAIHDVATNLRTADVQAVLGYIIMGLMLIVIGYGLGSALVARGPVSAWSRLGGMLLGLLNGAAIGGWLLRSHYDALNNNQAGESASTLAGLINDQVPLAIIWIWASYFPLAVALVAAIIGLVGPFRRAQTAVATPSERTDWAPAAAPATGAPATPNPYAPTTYRPTYSTQYPAAPPTAPMPSPYNPGAYVPPQSPYQTSVQVPDAPPTVLMPTSEMPRPSLGGQETKYFGGPSTPASAPPSAPTSAPSATPPATQVPRSAPSTPPSGYNVTPYSPPSQATPYGAPSEPSRETRPVPTGDSSWLSAPPSGSSSSSSPSPSPSSSSLSGSQPGAGQDSGQGSGSDEVRSRSEAPTMIYPVAPSASSPQGSSSSSSSTGPAESAGPDGSGATLSLVNCPRCGTLNPSDASFCTECGNRLKG